MTLSAIQSNAATAVAKAAVPPPPEHVAERRELLKAADVINASQTLGSANELVLLLDRTTHRSIMRVVDRKTNDVIMQIPSEDVLKLAADVQEQERRSQAQGHTA